MKRNLAFLAVSIAFASPAAFAAPQDLPVYRDNVGTDTMITGSGIPKDNFTVDQGPGATGTAAVALKARNRDTGQALSISGTTYYVSPGLSSVVTPGSPQLAFDFQFSPGNSGLTAENVILRLEVDFDRGPGTNFATITAPLSLAGANNSWDDSGGLFANNTCGGNPAVVACNWNTTDTYVYSQSWNLGFAFWSAVLGGPTNYNPSSPGTYDIRLTAFRSNTTSGSELASVSIQAVVVPEPSTLALLGLAALGLGALQRKQRKG